MSDQENAAGLILKSLSDISPASNSENAADGLHESVASAVLLLKNDIADNKNK